MLKKYSITKHFEFEASHRLAKLPYDSACKNLHGHTYKVNVTIETKDLDKCDMVIDFTNLKSCKAFIDKNLDHSLIMSSDDKDLINEIVRNQNSPLYLTKHFIMPNDWNVTAERFAELIADHVNFECVQFLLKDRILKVIVDVFETTNNKATTTFIYK